MLKVSIDQARPGMVLAKSIFDPETPDHILLKNGFELSEDYIKRLRSLRIFSAWINYPGLDFLDDLIDHKIVNQQQNIYHSLKNNFSQAQKQQSLSNINYGLFVGQIASLFERMVSTNCQSAQFINELYGQNEDIFMHGTQVASLAMLIGMKLENHIVRNRPNTPPSIANNLTPLGLGCLLHDIGKLTMEPEEIAFHLTAQNKGSARWQSHTEVGYQLIKDGLDPLAGQIILNHHQNFDGSGFPKRTIIPGTNKPAFTLKGDEIHIFCRIASLADRFINFRYLPDGRVGPNIMALKRLNNPGYRCWFDPIVFKAFMEAMPAFNLGDNITLNDGRKAVVLQNSPGQIFRPIVRIINLDSPETPGEDIDMVMASQLKIVKVDDFDITNYYFEPEK